MDRLRPIALTFVLALSLANCGSPTAPARVMAKRHLDAVGPWRAYLPILDR